MQIEDLMLFGANIEANDDVLNQKISGVEFGIGGKTTPVLLAAAKGDVETLKWLLEKGADFGVKDDSSHNVLMVASKCRQPQSIDFLLSEASLQSLFDVNDQSSPQKTTPLMAAMDVSPYTSRLKNRHHNEWELITSEILKTLVAKHNANVNLQNTDGQTALMVAIDSGNVIKVKLLLLIGEGKVNVNVRDNEGRTAVVYAVRRIDWFVATTS